MSNTRLSSPSRPWNFAETRRGRQAVKQAPEVSVIIPTFNRERLIGDAMQGVLTQESQGSIELIVVDDGSTDGTWEQICSQLDGARLPTTGVRLASNHGQSVARNVGVSFAKGRILAFTDDDCIPTPSWCKAGAAPFKDSRIGVVQGRTLPHPDQRQPFFSHFIEVEHLDGSYSTSNVFYRKSAWMESGGFDPELRWGEDVDLGWRVRRAGWQTAFAPQALAYHQIMPMTAKEWLLWPRHLAHMPVRVARYPGYRSHLFLGLWVDWYHALFDLALLSLPLALLLNPLALVFALPYLVAFPFRHGLKGKWPPVKAALHVAWDTISFFVLCSSSVRNRRLVL